MKREPIKALELKKSIQYGLGVIDAGSGVLSELSFMVDNVVDIAFQEGQSNPKIKQLEWDFSNSYGTFYSSHTPISSYLIIRDCDNYFKPRSDKYTLQINGQGKLKKIDLDEAKAAAQADFEKRVKQCLEL